MKRLTIIIALFALVLLVGCSSVTIKHDFDPDHDFAAMKTYNWFRLDMPDDDLAKNPLVQKRIASAVDRALKEKGYDMVEGDAADFAVTIHAVSKERMQIQNWGAYSSAYSPWWGPYGGQTDVSYYEEGTLVIDIVDRKNNELAWRGMATGTVRDKSRSEEEFYQIAVKILASFPPQ